MHCRRISVSLVWISCSISRILVFILLFYQVHIIINFVIIITDIQALYKFHLGTVTAKTPPSPSLNEALAVLKNNVYRGKFWLEMFDETGLGAIEVLLFLS